MSKSAQKKSLQRKTEPDHPAYNYCALPLAVYACRPDETRGRVFEEPESKHRTPFQRDRDRIIHASAFRRLMHKTQVFVDHRNDHSRTRMTHTLEVAQIARAMARVLMVNEDLAEAIALSHDLGHTPFAHIGEEFLHECMAPFGGFDHNDQSLRILTTLEQRYRGWNGLNLTWETLEGVVKHNGPHTGEIFEATRDLQSRVDLRLDSYASLEAQVAAIADDIAYNSHDLDDGLKAGLFTIDDLHDVAFTRRLLGAIEADQPVRYIRQDLVRDMIGAMVEDVIHEAQSHLRALNPQSADDVRMAGRTIVRFSETMRRQVDELRQFLFQRMYHHDSIISLKPKIGRVISELFTEFTKDISLLPEKWQKRIDESQKNDSVCEDLASARVVADYIAGMTDRYAIWEHKRLFNLNWDLR